MHTLTSHIQFNNKTVLLAGVSLALMVTATPTAFADEPQSESAQQSERDTVTVIGHAPSLALGAPAAFLDTPISTSTVEAETLLEQGGATLLDALRNVPGVQPDLSFVGSHSQVFVLRGSIADNGTQNSRILRDGARLSNYAFTPAFVDRLEVVRGPGAAAAVRSEPGGTVELVTKSAELDNFGTAYARIGEDSAQEYWVDVNRVLSKEHGIAARFVAVHSSASEWRHVPDKLDGLKINLTKSDGDRYQVAFDFEGTNQTYQPDFGVPGIDGRPAQVPLDRQLGEPFADSTTDNRVYSAHGNFKIADNTRLSLDYSHLDGQTLSVRNSVFRTPPGPRGVFNRVTAYEPNGERDIDSISLALTSIVETGAMTHNLFAGAEYYEETLNLPQLRIPPENSPPIDVFNPVYGLTTAPTGPLVESLTTQDSTSTLITLQDRIEVGRFNVIVGVQYVEEDSLYGGAGTLPTKDNRVSPKLGVTYALTPNQSIYASFTTGTSPQFVATATNESVPMRLSEQMEAGWKGEFLDGRIRTDFAIYRLDQDRTLTPDPAQFGRFFVNGETRSQGIELSTQGQITDRLSVNFAYAYTDAEFGDGSLYPGSRTPNVPYNSGNLFAQMQWNEHWRTGGGIYAQGDRFADGANATTLPGYVTIDLVQAYAFDINNQPLELQLNIRNLLDQKFYAGSHVHVDRYIMPGQGRNISLSAMYRF